MERYDVPAGFGDASTVDAATRAEMVALAHDDPDRFWLKQASRLDWTTAPTVAGDWSFDAADFRVRWFADGALNVAVNCIDRHLGERADQLAIVWEPDEPDEEARRYTYAELHAEVCRFANVLTALGVAKGDRVAIYLPMIPEAAFAMLACARLGAIHSVVFGGFSADALAGRIEDCGARLLVTADEGRRGDMDGNAIRLFLRGERAEETLQRVFRRRIGGAAMQWREAGHRGDRQMRASSFANRTQQPGRDLDRPEVVHVEDLAVNLGRHVGEEADLRNAGIVDHEIDRGTRSDDRRAGFDDLIMLCQVARPDADSIAEVLRFIEFRARKIEDRDVPSFAEQTLRQGAPESACTTGDDSRLQSPTALRQRSKTSALVRSGT